MNRRQFICGTGAASLSLTAGCLDSNSVAQTGTPEMEWEYEWEGFVGTGFQPATIVTGEIENVGTGYAEEFELECQLLAEDQSIIESRTRRLRYFETNEEQLFYYRFRPSEEETEDLEEVEVKGSFPNE